MIGVARAALVGATLVATLAACKMTDDDGSGTGAAAARAEPTTAAAAPGARPGVRFASPPPPPADVAEAVRAERARAPGKAVLVYEGATWCEPCQRFHAAALRGELDRDLPDLVLLEFDADRDRERLHAAGYVSQYIPLFALPGPDGRASGQYIEGSIKGEGAVGEITPRLKRLIGR